MSKVRASASCAKKVKNYVPLVYVRWRALKSKLSVNFLFIDIVDKSI